MGKKGLSQEGLKLIACITMLADHIGIVFLPEYIGFRLVGRMAFPIFCFLLVQGVQYTRNPVRYCGRLVISMLISEFSFDFLLCGRPCFEAQSVMVTLLLGFLMVEFLKRIKPMPLKLLAAVPFAVVARLLRTDYDAIGIVFILIFYLAKEYNRGFLFIAACITAVCFLLESWVIPFMGLSIPVELFCLFSLIPIACYSGRKATDSRLIQWGFYLFYPVHLLIIGILYRCF